MYLNKIYNLSYLSEIGKELSACRKENGLEIAELALKAGIKSGNIERLEKGLCRQLTRTRFEEFFRLCAVMRKKVVISFEDLPPDYQLKDEVTEELPHLTKGQILKMLSRLL